MEDYENLDLPALVDLLAQRTGEYTQLMSKGPDNGGLFAHIEQQVLALQEAIEARQAALPHHH